jgi:putative DNA methylase
MTNHRGDHASEAPKRKLIEVALPLETINRESARENYIYKGNPSSVHKWWAQRPLAAARAVLFAQLVDDPSSHPDRFPTEDAQRAERERLHSIIEQLVVWENTRDQALLAKAHAEILASTGGNPPPILDPFAGGGTIPLEAQRLGLEAHASDLNPVAVLINKALIEIPPKFAGRPPVFPGVADSSWAGRA